MSPQGSPCEEGRQEYVVFIGLDTGACIPSDRAESPCPRPFVENPFAGAAAAPSPLLVVACTSA